MANSPLRDHLLPDTVDDAAPISVLTGATRGIGRHVATAMATAGHTLILPGRNGDTSESLCRQLASETGNKRVYWTQCDLSDMASIRRATGEIGNSVSRIDVLVNNAGHFGKGFARTAEGFERHLAINYLAPFLLTHHLLDGLRQAPAGRIVNVAGETARIGRIRLDDLNRERRFSVLGAYAQSKLATMLFTRVLAARVAGTSMLVNAMQPGRAATNHLSAGPRWLHRLWRVLSPPPQRAANAVARLALHPNRAGTSGRYYMGRIRIVAPFAVYRRSLARALYAKTIDMVGLEPVHQLAPIGDGL